MRSRSQAVIRDPDGVVFTTTDGWGPTKVSHKEVQAVDTGASGVAGHELSGRLGALAGADAEGVDGWRRGSGGAVGGRADRRIGQWWSRALGSDGYERHTALLIGKSTLAATIAWVISYQLLNAQSPAFAPFSAVLIMQVTVYQSLVQSLRYVGAVVAGVAGQSAPGLPGGARGGDVRVGGSGWPW